MTMIEIELSGINLKRAEVTQRCHLPIRAVTEFQTTHPLWKCRLLAHSSPTQFHFISPILFFRERVSIAVWTSKWVKNKMIYLCLFNTHHCRVSTMRVRGMLLEISRNNHHRSCIMARLWHLRCWPLKYYQSTAKQLEVLAIAQLTTAEDDDNELLSLALAGLAADYRQKSRSEKYGMCGEYNQPKSKNFFDILLGQASERQFKTWFW